MYCYNKAFLFKFKSILYDNNSACPAETLVEHIKKKNERALLADCGYSSQNVLQQTKRFN